MEAEESGGGNGVNIVLVYEILKTHTQKINEINVYQLERASRKKFKERSQN